MHGAAVTCGGDDGGVQMDEWATTSTTTWWYQRSHNAALIQPEVNKLPEPSSPFKGFLTTHLYCFVFSSFTKMPAGLHSASFIALFSSDLCSLVLSDLILFSTSCSTEASLLKLCDFGKCYTSRVLLLQVHRSRAEHNAGGKILDCKRDTKVHLPAITCTIPRLLPN